MVDLKVYNSNIKDSNNIIYDIQLVHKMNLVIGESSSGKSYLMSLIESFNSGNSGDIVVSCNKKVEAVRSLSVLKDVISQNKDILIILDEDTVGAIRRNNKIVSMKDLVKSPNYFLLLDRQSAVKMDCNVKAVYEFSRTGAVGGINAYRAVHHFKLSDVNIDKIDTSKYRYLITEDDKSGKIFFDKLLGKLEVVDLVAEGNGAIANTITLEMAREGVLVALDYDCGALALQSIIYKCRKYGGRISLISMECFEEIVCNSDFILDAFPEMRDKVLNYENYLSANDKHTGKYFARLLKEYVKQRPPVETHSDRNVEKFYSKGADHIENCLTEDCCKYNKEDACKLYVNGDKQDKMLSNKFDWLNVFR